MAAPSALREVYDAGHRAFGENYVKELLDKVPEVPISSIGFYWISFVLIGLNGIKICSLDSLGLKIWPLVADLMQR